MSDADRSAAPASGPAGPAVAAARVLVQALTALGVREFVLAPGSRSAPLAYALAEAAMPDGQRPTGAPAIALHVRIDERTAGFLALGLARGSAHPVAIVTTSGTATANLHPAVLEAHHCGIPLIVLTADRPHEMRGTGANQTTDQVGLYGSATRFAADVPAPFGRAGEHADLRQLVTRAVSGALGARTGDAGPVHLNLAFREPLSPGSGDVDWPAPSSLGLTEVVRRGGPGLAPQLGHDPARTVDDVATTVVVAGDGAGPVAREIAETNGWPLLAEPSSGARGGANAIAAYRLLLSRAELGGRVRRAIVLGKVTLSRPVQALLARDDVEVCVLAPGGASWPDAGRRAAAAFAEVPPHLLGRPGDGAVVPVAAAGEWLASWQAAGAVAAAAVDRVLDAAPRGRRSRSGTRVRGPVLARAVARASRPEDVLVVGSSNPVRDLDLVAGWDEPPLVFSNRGLAGIDGTISTAIGVALASPGRRVRALMGDLTFLHDVGGLLRGPLEAEPDLQIVVANDDGGSIFATLEHGAPEHGAVFERVFAAPHGADLGALCAGYGVRHQVVREPADLAVALAVPGPGLSVVEVQVDRVRRRVLHERIVAAVATALG